MENKIISIDISPECSAEHSVNAGVMWEHNATVIEFNIDEAYVGDYRYYIEYRSLMGTRVRTQYLELNTETNTVAYSIPVSMSSLKGVECWFNIVSIDDDGNTQQIIKASKFCLTFDYSPDTDNQLCKVNDFSINALLEAIRLETFKGDKGEKGDKGDKGDKGETGGISEEYAAENFANAIKGYATGECVAINDVSPAVHPIKVKVKQKNLWNGGDVKVTNKYYLTILNCTLPAGKTYTLTADVESTDTDAEKCIVINRTNNNEILGHLGRGDRQILTFTLKGDCKEIELYASKDYGSSVGDTAIFKNIQLEEGTEATEYTPYVDFAEMNVKVCGKNLFDGEWESGSINTTTGEKQANSASIRTANYIPLKPNTAYCISLTAGANYFPYTFDENYGFVAYKGMKSGSFNIITGENEHYLIITQYGNTTPPVKAQIELGESATEYEEYKEVAEYTPSTDGTVENVASMYPTTVIFADGAGTTVECEYNKDTNKVIEKLVNAIISLGGNV